VINQAFTDHELTDITHDSLCRSAKAYDCVGPSRR